MNAFDILMNKTTKETEDYVSKLAEEKRKNEEIKQLLISEKARADNLHKKVRFIQDNKDIFNQLKEAYSNIKEGRISIIKENQDSCIQTNLLNQVISSNEVKAVRKKDLEEITDLVRELKTTIAERGYRTNAALEIERAQHIETRKSLENEIQQLKYDLNEKVRELNHFKECIGAGPREVSVLRRIIAKLIIGNVDNTSLTSKESLLAQQITKKYQDVGRDLEKIVMITSEGQDDDDLGNFGWETARSRVHFSPRICKEQYGTPRWIRGEDVP